MTAQRWQSRISTTAPQQLAEVVTWIEVKTVVFSHCGAAHQGIVLDLVEGGVLRVHLVFGQLCLQYSCHLVHIQKIVDICQSKK